MSLDAGSVYATLGGKVDASAFTKFGSLVDGAANNATKAEGRINNAWTRQRASAKRLSAEMQVATTMVENHSMQQRKSALAIEAAQAKAAAAEKKYGAESLQARQATLDVAAAQQRHAQGARQLEQSQKKLTETQAQHTAATRRGAASLNAMGSAAKTGALVGLAALAAGTVYSVRKSMDLQKALAEVQAVTRAGPQTMAKYKQAAIELGTSTGVGATQAAGALAELAKGGLSVDDTLTALQGTIALAQAGGMDLATAGETVAQSLNLFNMKGSEATKVADSFANAANATTADVSFFAQGMAQGGAAAKAAGLTFDETTVALEMLAANGFKSGSDAGTSLKTTFTQIAHPTKQASEEMKKLGLNFFDGNGKIKSVSEMAGMLGDKLGGLTKKQRLSAAATIAGTDGMRALLALYDQGSAKADKFGKANAQSGTAARTAADKTNNLEGNIDKLKAQFDALAISAGDELVPALTDATRHATKFMQEMRSGKGTGGDFATTVDDITGALKTVADSPVMGGIWDTFKSKVEGSGMAISGIAKAVDGILTLDPGKFFDGLITAADGAAKQILAPFNALKDGIKDALGAGEAKPKVKQTTAQNIQTKVVMQTADLGGDLTRIAGLKIPPKVLRVVGSTADAETKVKALQGLKLPDKYQKVLAQDVDARVKLAAVAAMAKGATAAKVLKITSSLGGVGEKLDALRAAAQAATRTRELKIATKDGDAVAALKAIDGTKLGGKVVAILAKDGPAKTKIQALIDLGIPAKTAKMLGNNSDALKKAAALNSTTLETLSQNMVRILANPGFTGPAPPPVSQKVIRAAMFATGRGADGEETALVGEGAGKEHVGNPDKGWRTVTGPTWMRLAADDYVIPTESRYAGNAMRFLTQMYGSEAARVAHEMGVSGYKGGRLPKHKRQIPSKVYASHSTDYYDGVVSTAETRLSDLKSSANERDSKKRLTAKAKSARGKLARAEWDLKEARNKAKAAKDYASKIEAATKEADIQRSLMENADKADDQPAYDKAFNRRKDKIKRAIELLKIAIPGWADNKGRQELRQQLADLSGQALDKSESVFDAPADPTTYTVAEQKRLDELNRAIAEAELTDTTTDDVTALQGKETWLSGILQSAIQNPSARGGDNAVTQIAGELKSTRDSLVQLTKAPDVTSDMQAQLDQANERTRIASENARVNAGVLAAFTGSGDIGAGGPSAYRAAGGVTVNFQSYVPPSPQEARRLADHTVAGLGYQGAPPSPRQVV